MWSNAKTEIIFWHQYRILESQAASKNDTSSTTYYKCSYSDSEKFQPLKTSAKIQVSNIHGLVSYTNVMCFNITSP